ncbi:hypothetical protein L1887_09170 [Cichorium endivia]|nr:hypothetical protein L1887_09170 [Cichorium endivia]
MREWKSELGIWVLMFLFSRKLTKVLGWRLCERIINLTNKPTDRCRCDCVEGNLGICCKNLDLVGTKRVGYWVTFIKFFAEEAHHIFGDIIPSTLSHHLHFFSKKR